MGLEAAELARWTRFAAKGGIGKCSATCDCVAESADDLMFLKDDEITVLLQIPDREGYYLGYCEGVVGRFSGADVRFHSKLKKPVMTKRSSSHFRTSKAQVSQPTSPITSNSHITTRVGSSATPDQFSTSSSRTQTPVAQFSPPGSVLNSPTVSTFSRAGSSAGMRNSTSEMSRSGSSRGAGAGSRNVHVSTIHPEEPDPVLQQSFSALAEANHTSPSKSSSSLPQEPQSPSSSSTSSPVFASVSGSPSTKRSHVPLPLNLESPKQEASQRTAPLRIIKRVPSSPSATSSTSPQSQSFPLHSKSSVASLSSIQASHLAGDHTPVPHNSAPNFHLPPDISLALIHNNDPSHEESTPSRSTLPSALDTSLTSASTYEDLHQSHPGRFSRYSMSPSLAMSNLLGVLDSSSIPSSSLNAVVEGEDQYSEPSMPLAPSPNINGRMSHSASLTEAARGKVDEATLASTQAQVGIGLSLLQDLVGGMGSDSDSDSDYEESPSKSTWATTTQGGDDYLGRGGSAVFGPGTEQPSGSGRVSVAASEDSTAEGLRYASTDEGHHDSPQSPTFNPVTDLEPENPVTPLFGPPDTPSQDPAFLSPTTSPTIPTFPFSQSWQHTGTQDSTLTNHIGRERRPSLAQSVVSGTSAASVSARSGTSSSWDGDIYDNYRYSRFSVAAPAANGRKSMDSVRVRTDSGSQAGRKRSSSGNAGLVSSNVNFNDSLEDHPVPNLRDHLTATAPNAKVHARDTSVASAASVYTQNSRLSTLSSDVVALVALDDKQRSSPSRPPPLSLVEDVEGAMPNNSPLLHTNWPSPSPATSTLQTAIPPFTATPGTPHPGLVTSEGTPDLLSSTDECGLDAHVEASVEVVTPLGFMGLASTLRKKVENVQQPFPSNSAEGNIFPGRGAAREDSFSAGHPHFDGNIVAEDTEEIPSRLTADDDDPEGSLEDDTFVDHNLADDSPVFSQAERRMSLSPEPQTSIGRLEALIVTNRTPSPSGAAAEPPSPLVPTQPSVSPSSTDVAVTPPGSTDTQAPSAQLRPHTLAPNLAGRRSLFLPHPNAPKLLNPPGQNPAHNPGYHSGQPPIIHPGPYLGPPLRRPPVQEIIRLALSSPPRILQGPPGRPALQLGPTIFGQTEADLYNSYGPVPIAFSIEPRPYMHSRATAPGGVLRPIGSGPPLSNHFQPVPIAPRHSSTPQQDETQTTTRPAPAPQLGAPRSENTTPERSNITTNALPRANFNPKTPGIRPRSRSFSGFNSPVSDKQQEEVADKSKSDLAVRPPRRTMSSSVSAGPLGTPTAKTSAKSSPLRPSPLSLSAVGGQEAGSPSTTARSPMLPTSPSKPSGLRSNFTLSPPSPSTSTLPASPRGVVSSASTPSETVTIPSEPPTPSSPSLNLHSSNGLSRRTSLSRTTSVDASGKRTSGAKPSDDEPQSRPQESSTRRSSSIGRHTSLRAKMSLPNLRKVRNRSEDDNEPSHGIYDRDKNPKPGFNERDRDPPTEPDMARELVQVQDMEFEFVRPNLAQLQSQARASSDSIGLRRENSLDSRGDTSSSFLRAESPATSLLSSAPRSPVVDIAPSPSTSLAAQLSVESSVSIEAHRQREGKWVALMSSSPAALSRKSKKVKKMLLEGVPSSVRYLIWSYVTDGKGRAVKGVYEQLCKRGEVSRTDTILADVNRLAQTDGEMGTEYFSGVKDAIVALLQAYFTMVPDVQYSIGLVKIAGQLLVLAPEEDAFWIFTSIMDTHIRSYFSFATSNPPSSSLDATSFQRSTQLEVDASLFARALEANDSSLSKKLLIDLSIPPGVICQHWLTSLFVGVYPPEYIHRIWDIFLYEGVTFLLRVSLALTLACRRFLITSKSDSQALMILRRPPPSTYPATPDALLNAALSVKLKDDDVRKQRLKIGNIVKRQTQASQGAVAQNGISLPRT